MTFCHEKTTKRINHRHFFKYVEKDGKKVLFGFICPYCSAWIFYDNHYNFAEFDDHARKHFYYCPKRQE